MERRKGVNARHGWKSLSGNQHKYWRGQQVQPCILTCKTDEQGVIDAQIQPEYHVAYPSRERLSVPTNQTEWRAEKKLLGKSNSPLQLYKRKMRVKLAKKLSKYVVEAGMRRRWKFLVIPCKTLSARKRGVEPNKLKILLYPVHSAGFFYAQHKILLDNFVPA